MRAVKFGFVASRDSKARSALARLKARYDHVPPGKADVIVCDGFVGNVLLKFAEGMGSAIGRWLPGALKAHLLPSVAGSLEGLLEGAIDLTGVGGGPLFGVKGVVVIGHGRARAAGVAGAISMAKRVWEADLVEAMQSELGSLRSLVKE